MYLVNPYYVEALKEEDVKIKARIKTNSLIIKDENIKSIKYDLNINDSEKFTIGGVYGATVTLTLLNYDNKFDNFIFENKVFEIDLAVAVQDLYTVGKFNKEFVGIVNALKIKHITSLWIPQGKFFATEIVKNENRTITIKLIDKTKYLDDEYVCNLTVPFTLKQLYDDVHSQAQILSDTTTFYNQNVLIQDKPVGYTRKQILGYISECACGFYLINRLGNAEIKQYSTDILKIIEKGEYKKFLPAENYITIQKIKYAGSTIIGGSSGYVLEIDEKNLFINETVAQNILLKMQGFTFIPYTYNSIVSDMAIDVGDKIDITNTNNIKYLIYVMGNSWEYSGSLKQNWTAKGENELNNTYITKGPITQQLENIVREQIPNAKEEAIKKATELLTDFNGGYVVKKDGELFISDNEDIDQAEHIWRWNINGLGYSSTGIDGPYGVALTMDGRIVANYITTGFMSADRLQGGTLKIGGINNINGEIQVVDASGNELVKINLEGITLSNGTKLIGGNGVLSNFKFDTGNWAQLGFSTLYNDTSSKIGQGIVAYIPSNFEIISATVTVHHSSRYVYNLPNIGNKWCYSRNVKLYKASDIEKYKEIGNWASGSSTDEYVNYNEVSGAFGSNGFTGLNPNVVPTIDTIATNKFESINIKDEIESGKCNYFKLESSESIPTTDEETYTHTGLVIATLNVIGYMK